MFRYFRFFKEFFIDFELKDLPVLYLNPNLQKVLDNYYKTSENPNDEFFRCSIQDYRLGIKHLYNSPRGRFFI